MRGRTRAGNNRLKQLTMKRITTIIGMMLIVLSLSAQSEGMLLRHTEVIGDAMGEGTGITQWTKPLYDKYGRVAREAVYGKDLDNSIELTRYTTNIFDNQGRMVESSSQQYGFFDGDDMAFHASEDTTTYVYDARGNLLIEETQRYQKIEYTYDEQDNCIKKVRYNYARFTGEWEESETTEYSDFLPGFVNKPTKINNTGRWDSYVYVGEIAYDEAGRMLSEKHYNNWNRMKLVGNSMYWTYDDNGRLTMYEKKYVNDSGQEEDYRRTIYILQSNTAPDVERIEQHSQNCYTDGKWYNDPTYLIHEYTRYDHARFAPAITASHDDNNVVTLVVTMPEQAFSDSDSDGDRAALKILDNGIVLDIVTMAAARDKGMLSADGKTITWTSGIFRNGHHEMTAQYVQTTTDAPTTDTTIDWNISNAVSITLDKQLPAPSNLRGVVAEKDKYDNYDLTVMWDAAENAEEYAIQRYNVILQNHSIADNDQDPTKGMELTWTIKGLMAPVTFMVQAVYPYGKANSEYVTLDPKDFLVVMNDTRICVEEERTWIDGSKTEVRKYFVDKTDKVVRSSLYENEDEDENENENGMVLESYAKWEYSSEEKPQTITVTTDNNVQVRTCTYNEEGRLAEYSYDAEEDDAKYKYTVVFTYDGIGRLDTETVKQTKYKSNGSLGTTKTLSQTKYIDSPDDDYIVNGVYSEYNSLSAKWTEVATVKRYMMPAKSIYAPTAEVKANTLDGLTISVKPSAETMTGTSAFNIYRDGEMIAQGIALYDEEHVVQSEYGEFQEWLFKDEYQGAGKVCEYIVQYATLDNNMNYNRAYSIAEPLTVDFDQATDGISPPTPEGGVSDGDGIYNLAGQKVQRGYKGIVISKGRKRIL